MYIHIGADTVVRESSVIGIFDLDNTSSSRITRDFLSRAQREGRTETVGEDLPRSFVLTGDGERERVYLTLLASRTLAKRAADGGFI